MKRIKVIKFAISFLQSLERAMQKKSVPAANQRLGESQQLREAEQLGEAQQDNPERLLRLKKKLAFLEQELNRVSTIDNPNITLQEAEAKKKVIKERLEVAADLLADIPIMEKCPIAPFCEKCRDTNNIYHTLESLCKAIEFQLQHLEFSSFNFVSNEQDNIHVS